MGLSPPLFESLNFDLFLLHRINNIEFQNRILQGSIIIDRNLGMASCSRGLAMRGPGPSLAFFLALFCGLNANIVCVEDANGDFMECYACRIRTTFASNCAIYEPKSKMDLCTFFGMGYRCPRKVLINSNTKVIDCPNPDHLGNANTPEDLQRFQDQNPPKLK